MLDGSLLCPLVTAAGAQFQRPVHRVLRPAGGPEPPGWSPSGRAPTLPWQVGNAQLSLPAAVHGTQGAERFASIPVLMLVQSGGTWGTKLMTWPVTMSCCWKCSAACCLLPAACCTWVVYNSRPGNELLAFQELHDRRLTLIEGRYDVQGYRFVEPEWLVSTVGCTLLILLVCSVLRPADLVRYRAASASAILVMANRFSPDVETEDLDVLFRVWAIKSFTKCVPLTVQVRAGKVNLGSLLGCKGVEEFLEARCQVATTCAVQLGKVGDGTMCREGC